MKKGFTLIELLATVVVLGAVTVVVVPNLSKIFTTSKESTAKQTINNLIRNAKYYYANNISNFDYNKNLYENLALEGSLPTDAKIFINKDEEIKIAAILNNKCYYKDYSEAIYNETTNISLCNIAATPIGEVIQSIVPPVINVSEKWHKSDATVVINLDSSLDPFIYKTEYKLIGNTNLGWTEGSNITISNEGETEIIARVVKYNSSAVSKTVSKKVKIDKTAPTLVWNTSGINWSTKASATPSYSDANGSGIDTAFYTWSTATSGVNPTTYMPNAEVRNFDDFDTVAIRIHGKVCDKAGNCTQNYSNAFKIDKTAPTCVSSGGSANWTSGSITLIGTCNDSGSGCSNISALYNSSFNTTTASPGIVTDNVGNSSFCPSDQTVRIDKTAPSVPTLAVNEAWTNQSYVTATAAGSVDSESGISRYEISLSGSTILNWSNATSINIVNEGLTTITVRTINNVGLISSTTSKVVRIDRTAPTCTSSGGSTTWTNGNRTLTGTCADTGGSGCSGNATNTISTNTNTTTASPGTVTDGAGNTAACPANQTVRIDKTAPTCASSGGTSVCAISRIITGTCSDTGGSGCVTNVSKNYNGTFESNNESPGTVSDNAGNTTVCPANQTVRVSSTAPSLSVSTVSGGSGASYQNIRFYPMSTGNCATISDIIEVNLSNGATRSIGYGSGTYSYSTSIGPVNMAYRIVDQFGRTSSNSNSVTVYVNSSSCAIGYKECYGNCIPNTSVCIAPSCPVNMVLCPCGCKSNLQPCSYYCGVQS